MIIGIIGHKFQLFRIWYTWHRVFNLFKAIKNKERKTISFLNICYSLFSPSVRCLECKFSCGMYIMSYLYRGKRVKNKIYDKKGMQKVYIVKRKKMSHTKHVHQIGFQKTGRSPQKHPYWKLNIFLHFNCSMLV